MATLKKFLAYMLGGAILGAVVASLIGPGVISWYNSPGYAAPPGFDLAPFARHVTQTLIQAQLVGAGIGAMLLLVFGIAIHRSRGKKAEQAALSATASTAVAAPVPARPAVKDGPPPM
ncbi:MAG: hypothetical protein ACYC8T_00315 [Myxococcaceae bacterium]